jgi:gas vesicle protein
MADQTLQQAGTNRPFGQQGDQDRPATPQTLREHVASAGREVKDKASGLADKSGEKLKEQAAEFGDMAKDVASQASDRLKDTMAETKGAGAEYVGNLAETIRRAAKEFDNELPIAGKYIRKAAAQVDNVSDSLRTGDFNDLIEGAQTFARRQPTAFLGLAALAGFAAVRFLKSSPETSRSAHQTGGQSSQDRSSGHG